MKKLNDRKNQLVFFFVFIAFSATTMGQTYIIGGDVGGTWSSTGSPYYIQGEITVPNG
jgi:hypothetical protein